MIVLDCSAAVDMARGTSEGKALMSLMLPEEEVIAPHLLQCEAANAFWKYVHAGKMSKEEALDYLSNALSLVTEYRDMRALLPEVFAESIRLDHPAYDLFYFVFARRNDATMFTLDKKLIALCEEHGVDCMHPVPLS